MIKLKNEITFSKTCTLILNSSISFKNILVKLPKAIFDKSTIKITYFLINHHIHFPNDFRINAIFGSRALYSTFYSAISIVTHGSFLEYMFIDLIIVDLLFGSA